MRATLPTVGQTGGSVSAPLRRYPASAPRRAFVPKASAALRVNAAGPLRAEHPPQAAGQRLSSVGPPGGGRALGPRPQLAQGRRRNSGGVADVSEPMSDLWTEAEEELSPVAPPYAVDVLKSMEDIQMDDADLNIRPMPLYPSYPLGRKGITSYPLTYTLDGIDLDLDLTESAEVEGTVVGAIALITGSTVGAGVLALPATVAPAGFLPSTAVLTGCWAFLLVQALLLAEVCVAVMRERDELRREHGRGHTTTTVSIPEMATRTLGDGGRNFVSSLYLFLSVALLTAYIAKAGEVLALVSPTPSALASGIFSLSIATVLCFGGTRTADLLNRGLTAMLLLLFSLIIGVGTLFAEWESLGYQNWEAASACAPIVILSLVFHDLVPVVCSYLNGNADKIRKSLCLGSAVPLVMFATWDAVALAIAPQAGVVGGDPLTTLMSQVGGTDYGGAPGTVISLFSLVALATSFIGTSLGLSAYATNMLTAFTDRVSGAEELLGGGEVRGPAEESALTRAWSGLPLSTRQWWDERGINMSSYYLVLALPLSIACVQPDIFLGAATFVGGYGNTVLYGMLPPLMAWQMRPRKGESFPRVGGQGMMDGVAAERYVPGGNAGLLAAGLGAVGIFTSRAVADLSRAAGDMAVELELDQALEGGDTGGDGLDGLLELWGDVVGAAACVLPGALDCGDAAAGAEAEAAGAVAHSAHSLLDLLAVLPQGAPLPFLHF